MDPSIAAALIGLVPAAAGAIYGFWQKRKAQSAIQQTERAAVESVKRQAQETVYSLSDFEVITSFTEEGSGTQERIYRTIRVKESQQDLAIPFVCAVSPPGRVLPPPPPSELPESKHGVQFGDLTTSESRIEGKVEILGPLNPGEPARGFFLRLPFEHGIRMSRADVRAAYRNERWKTEYVSGRVDVPTDRLRVCVKFPDSHAALSSPPPAAVSFLGTGNEIVHEEETARIANKLSYVEGIATLEVEAPVPSLRYAIWWLPPK